MKKSRQNIILAVICSVAIHVATGLIIYRNLSADLYFPERFHKLNLIWASWEIKKSTDVAEKLRPAADSSRNQAARGVITKGTPSDGNVQAEIVQTAAPGLTSSVNPAGGPAAKTAPEQIRNLPGNAAGEKAGSPVTSDNAFPLYREHVLPVYPQIARIRGYEGVVLISTEILPCGGVGKLLIKKSSGYAILDQAAMEAAKNWKFEPAKKMGRPYAVWRDHVIRFFLNDDNSPS